MITYPTPLKPGDDLYVAPGKKQDCPARSPKPAGGWEYYCTRDAGHVPPHAAHDGDSDLVATWEGE